MAQNDSLNKLRSEESALMQGLKASSTALSGKQPASTSDMASQARLLKIRGQIQSLQDKEIQEKWYGKNGTQVDPKPGGDVGFVGNMLDRLQRPLYGVVGAVDYATGKGESSLFDSISKNALVKKRTFGNVLSDSGVPKAVSMPVGFAMDVAFDPINWLTAGTTALVPRAAVGLSKAGVSGLTKGVGSSLLHKASVVGGLTPGFRKTGTFAKLAERSIKSGDEFDALIKRDFLAGTAHAGEVPGSAGMTGYRLRIGDLMKEAAQRAPFVGQYAKYFDYNNAEWTRLARIKDTLERSLGTGDIMNAATKAYIRAAEKGESFDDVYKQALSQIQERIQKAGVADEGINWDDGLTAADKIPDEEIDRVMSNLASIFPGAKSATDAESILKNPEPFVTSDSYENALRLAAEDTQGSITMNDLKDIIGRGELGDTGWKFFDDLKQQITGLKTKVGVGKYQTEVGTVMKNTLDALQAFTMFFKRGKVGASPTAWTNAVIGNPVMAWMAGVNILDPQYMKRVKDASKVAYGVRDSDLLLAEFMSAGEMLKVMDTNPGLFSKTLGVSPRYLEAKNLLEKVVRAGKDAGMLNDSTDLKELGKAVGVAFDEILDAMKELSVSAPATMGALEKIGGKMNRIPLQRPSQYSSELRKSGKALSELDLPTGMMANEFFDSNMGNKMLEYIGKRANEGNPIFKLLDVSFNKAGQAYEGIDQSFKMGTVMYATMDGLTEAELQTIRRFIKLDPSDLTRHNVNGVRRYTMDGAKALELANEIYLNYNAMPAAVKVLRGLPIVGSPFASFMYGMAAKTGKTLAYNPAAFNKVSFAQNELSGDQSPLEKGVLSDPRYQYLNDPAMVKIPNLAGSKFFDTYSLYLNTANMIPYYSFNMFTPSERKYNELYADSIVGTIDRTPFLKDPIGSVIFDYLIQPMVLQKSFPQGSFGQPLYPQDASVIERAGYAGRQLADSVTPGFWAIPGGLATGYAAPGATEFMPGYRWRQIAYAMQGKSSIGKTVKEPAASRTLRSIAGTAGIPVQAPLPLTYLPKELGKKVKDLSN